VSYQASPTGRGAALIERTDSMRVGSAQSVQDDERDAIKAAQQGDVDALHRLYDRHAAEVYAYVRGIVRDRHEAEDVTQNVFIKLMRIIDKYEEREVPFSSWLLRVARNVALDHLRQRRPVPCESVYEADARVTSGQFERNWMLREALAGLPSGQREVVVARHLLGLTPPEIAVRMGKTEGSVHALHHRGRRALRSSLRVAGMAPSTRGG